jgi:bleomycin hydrolase
MELVTDQYEKNFEMKKKYKVLQGILGKTNITSVSVNQNALNKLPFKFNHSLPEQVKITNQMYSGRCWIFAGLNIFRHKLIAHHKLSPNFELSQSYLFYWDKLEKCNTAIELIYHLIKEGKGNSSLEYTILIQNVMGDGGTWPMFCNLVEKYGVMPKDSFPDNAQARNTGKMNEMLNITVMKTSDVISDKMDIDEFRKYKKTILEECFRIVNICIGNIPKKFSWTFKETKNEIVYTPKSFYNKIVKPFVDVKKYISICNFPLEDYNQLLAVEYLHNVLNKGDNVKTKITNMYLNIENKIFKDAVHKSISKNKSGVWFACDVGQFWMDSGSVLDKSSSNLKDMFDIDFSLPKRVGIETRISVPTHAMMFVGCQKNENEYERWKVENSHGELNKFKGYINMSDNWFDDYVICAAVPFDCLPVNLRKIAKNQMKVKWLPFYSPLGVFA